MHRPRPWLTRALLAALMLVAPAAHAAGRSAKPTPYPGGVWQPGPARFAVSVVHNIAIPMSDGVTLYGDARYPADLKTGERIDRRFPVILSVNPYATGADTAGEQAGNVAQQAFADHDYFVQRGYVSLIVDARGSGRSDGADEFLSQRQQRDGAELIQYAAHALDGSNGVVGLFGCSYLGEWTLFNAANAAAAGPSPVHAAVPQCASGDFFREFFNVGGLMTSDFPAIEAMFAAMDASPLTPDPASAPAHAAEHASGVYHHFATAEEHTVLGGDRAYENQWWQSRAPINRATDIVRNRIPTLMTSSWNDLFPAGALEMTTALQNLERRQPERAPLTAAPRPSGRYQLIIGPGGHASGLSKALSLEWFDTWLKGVRTGMADTSRPLHLWVNGADRWVDTDRYPLAARYASLYLGAGGALAARPPTAPTGADTLAWAPASAGNELTYRSTPLRRRTTLAGPSGLVVYASSSTHDVELIATLSAVSPAGAVTRLAKSGALIGSQRRTDPRRTWRDADGRLVRPYHLLQQPSAEPVPVGKVVRYEIEIPPTSWELPAGTRLQLTLQSQNYDAPGSNLTGADATFLPTAAQLPNLVGGSYAVQRTRIAASVLNLPLLPAGASALAPTRVDWGRNE